MTIRVGHGIDVHRFDATRPLVLGGLDIPGAPGLTGHSDADVVSHAIADALLGAAGLGDLGTHFPSDERWRDASSIDILREVTRLLAAAGASIVNVDVTVVAEAPRLAPYRDEMRKRVAGALACDPGLISIKATTTDGIGFTGRREGMAALAVALVEST
ncbi:MAG TPA: 2-C-methyl-D-erythritol 2,4-cyclodiphosphate synthase [Actinomycetota bacterium]|jgi:2-C-methyl-D-erythritol 2,4-cyclodiphosphate synthase|nr:2-C-methyl-D-erythritol 2,4-cyclodiphosphate synthase [Actinomycetota bacterium]